MPEYSAPVSHGSASVAAVDGSDVIPSATRPDVWGATIMSGLVSGERPLARRFAADLARSGPTPPGLLPSAFRPLAEAIAGRRDVLVSTDTASRRALRGVGKVAATTGNVIHLDREPTASPRSHEVLAHELTHVAHPSPTVRFFDDDHDSPEERRAESVARLMTRSSIAPTATALGATVRRVAASDVASASTSTSASALVEHLQRSSSTAAIQRRVNAQPSGPTPAPPADVHSAEQSAVSSSSARSGGAAHGIEAQLKDSDEARSWFAAELAHHFDSLVHALEDRMIVEFERRGGRHWSTF